MKRQADSSEFSLEGDARRQFLAKCGRFAVVTPPAMTMLLSVAAKPQEAHASSILGGGWKPGKPGKKPPKPSKPPKPPKNK
jgi:hypothetical protein